MLQISSKDLDFGFIPYVRAGITSSSSFIKVFQIKNTSPHHIKLAVDATKFNPVPNSNVPVMIYIYHSYDQESVSATSNLRQYLNELNEVHGIALTQDLDDSSKHHGIDNIILKSLQSVNIFVIIIPLFVSDYDGTSPRHGRTSLFKISLKLCVTYSLPAISGAATEDGVDEIKVTDFSSERINESIVNINSTLCTPILHIDEREIDFDSCILNNTYIRDFQLWNRSECNLFVKINYAQEVANETNCPLVFQEYDTGRVLPYGDTQNDSLVLNAFASKRIRISCKATELGYFKYNFHFENLTNPLNILGVTCKVHTILKEENDVFSIEYDSGLVLQTGQVLEFGDCYCGVPVTKRLWLKNTSKDELSFQINSNHPEEISFDTSGRFLQQNESSNSLDRSVHTSVHNTSAVSKPTISTTVLSLILPTEGTNNKIKNESGSNTLSWTNINTSRNVNSVSKLSSITVSQDFLTGYSLPLGVDSDTYEVTDLYKKEYHRHLLGDEYRLFVSGGGNKVTNSRGSSSPEMASSVGNFRNQFKITNYQNYVTYDEDSHENIRNSSSNEKEFLYIAPGATRLIIVTFSPSLDSGSKDPGSMVGRKLKITISWKERQRHDSFSALSSTRMTDLDQFYDINNNYMKRNIRDDSMGNEGISPLRIKNILCRARTCISSVSVAPTMYDLGECKVGQYRTATLMVTNNSDLPATIIPSVESETLSVIEKELKIPPRQRLPLHIDYVARIENTDYKRNMFLINNNNSTNINIVEIRAKNVDTQQVLLHSLFYKIYTYNSERMLQLYYDKCLYNMSNFRCLSIKNIYSEPLTLRLEALSSWVGENNDTDFISSDRDGDIQVYLLITSPSSELSGSAASVASNAAINTENVIDMNSLSDKIEALKWGNIRTATRRTSSFSHDDAQTTSAKSSSNESTRDNVKSLNDDVRSDMKRSGSESDLTVSKVATDSISGVKCKAITLSKENASKPIAVATVDPLRYAVEKLKFDNNDPLLVLTKENSPFYLLKDSASNDVKSDEFQDNSNVSSNNMQRSTYADKNIDTINNSVHSIQRCYREIDTLMKGDSRLYQVQPDQLVTIPVGKSYHFLVIFTPKSGSGITAGNNDDVSAKRAKVDEELEYNPIERALQVKLVSVDSTHVEMLKVKKNESNITTGNTNPIRGEPLKPRVLPIRGHICRSEMIALQKNINFGRIVVGDTSTRGVTIVNRSIIPCMYSISKSGSISSGFLTISSGRKSIIQPQASSVIEFTLKPALAGSFEETIQIENVLNPANVIYIIVKAKVIKPESFQLLHYANESHELLNNKVVIPSGYNDSENVNSESADLLSNYHLKDELLTSLSRIEISEGISVPPTFLGDIAVGESCDFTVTFRIRNTTAKSRQFIVDAAHSDAISLFLAPGVTTTKVSAGAPGIVGDGSTALSDNTSERTNGKDAPDSNFRGPKFVPFEPIPEILQSILSLSCRFENITQEMSSVSNALPQEQKAILEDKLEHFQQKLKIAIRKNKPEKILKYETKIRQAKATLAGEILVAVNDDGDSDAEKDGNKEKKGRDRSGSAGRDRAGSTGSVDETITPYTPQTPSIPLKTVTIAKSEQRKSAKVIGESDVTYHLVVGPEVEEVIRVKITFMPGIYYRHWKGSLPFKGYLRIYECKNEDLIKVSHFGAMVFPSRQALTAALSPSPLAATGSSKGLDSRLDRVTEIVGPPSPSSKYTVSNKLLRSMANCFLTSVAQWSSLHTRQLSPMYRFINYNILGMSMKLVQPSKDRMLRGCVSIASLLNEEIVIEISVVNNIDVRPDADTTTTLYELYDPVQHGKLAFSVGSGSGVGITPISDANDENKTNYFKCKVGINGYFECLVQLPPPNVDAIKQSLVAKGVDIEKSGDIKIVGVLGIRTVLETDTRRRYSEDTEDVQYVPVVWVVEHKSVFKVDKTLNFGEVPVGSILKLPTLIHNLSEDDLHYVTSPATVGITARAVGSVDFISGHTGIIPACSTKEVECVFSATSLGKFEQELWVRNMNDQFDLNRITLIANVVVSQSQFVIFPDLESTNSTSDADKKIKQMDFGLIQIPNDEASKALLASSNDYKFKLRVRNVSSMMISVTAVSNLKSQCFIFADENCTQSVVGLKLPPSGESTQSSNSSIVKSKGVPSATSKLSDTILHIVIRPPSKSVSDKWYAEGNDNTKKNKYITGRELVGGVRLVFFADDPMDQTIVSPVMAHGTVPVAALPSTESLGPNRKLFETTVAFKAIVGCSLLRVSTLLPKLHYVSLKNINDRAVNNSQKCDPNYFLQILLNQRNSICKVSLLQQLYAIKGSFQLENISPTFPLRYQYKEYQSLCIGCNFPLSDRYSARWITNYTNSKVSHAIQLYILDDVDTMGISTLNPLQTKVVNYVIIFSNETKGLWTQDIVFENIDTKDIHTAEISVFLDTTAVDVVTSTGVASPAQEIEYSSESLESDLNDGNYAGKVYCSTSSTQLYVRADTYSAAGVKYDLVSCADNKNTIDLFDIYNNTAEAIQLSPLANIPITIESVATERIDRSESSAIVANDMYQRCGEDIAIGPNSHVTVRVCGNIGSQISVPMRSRSSLDSGCNVVLKGKIGFILNGAGGTNSLVTSTDSLDCLPFIAYRELLCNVVIPKIEIPTAQLQANLGEFRRGYRVKYTFTIRNTCELPIPITVFNLPSWLLLTNEQSSLDTVVAIVDDSFILPVRSLCTFSIVGVIPKDLDTTCSAVDVNFLINNCCYNQATEIKLKLNIDSKSAISLLLSAMEQDAITMDEMNNHYSISASEPVMIPSTIVATATRRNITTTNVDSLANVKLVLRNNLNRLLKIQLALNIPHELRAILSMNIAVSASNELFQLSNSANKREQETTNNFFNILPGDSNEIKITCESHAGARITRDILSYISAVTNINASDVGVLLGPIVLGTIDLLVLNEQDEIESEVYQLDVCGNLQPGPTIQLLTEELDETHLNFIAIDNSPAGEALGVNLVNEALNNPSLRLETEVTTITLYNSSSSPVLYTTKPKFYKHLGMRLKFNDDDEGEYDTIMIIAEPNIGSIPPLSTFDMKICLRPGNSPNIGDREIITCKQDRNIDTNNDGLMTVMDMTVDIYDDEFDYTHPPMPIKVLLASKIALPIIISKPLSNTDQSKIYLGGANSQENLLGNYDDSDESSVRSNNMSEKAPSSSSAIVDVSRKPSSSQLGLEPKEKPKIRLRGVTPVVDTQDFVFEINLGQQIIGQESIEWSITLENCSAIEQVRFKVLHMANPNASWLIFGQTRGSIELANSFSLTLYFYRAVLGSFFTYFVIENVDNKADYQLVRVSVEVIEENVNVDIEERDNNYREIDLGIPSSSVLPQSVGGSFTVGVALPLLKTVDMLIVNKLNLLERNVMILCRSFSDLWSDLLEIQYLHEDYSRHHYIIDQDNLNIPTAPLPKQLSLATEVLLGNSDLVATDFVLFINKIAVKARLATSASAEGVVLTAVQRSCHRIASRLADLFLLYQGIIDQIIIHKLSRQLVNVGNNNIQVECLAQVLFVLMFRSHLFDTVLQETDKADAFEGADFPLLMKPFIHLFFKYFTISGEHLAHHHAEALENIYEKLVKRRKGTSADS